MRKTSLFARALAAFGFAASVLAPTGDALAGDQLTIVSWGGAYQTALRKAYFEPFAKASGFKVTEEEYSGDIAKIRAMVDSKSVSWDVLDASGSQAWIMCEQALLEKIDWKKLGLDRSKFGDAGKFECGVPIQTNATILAYDPEKMRIGPQTIKDLFDTTKFPGKRGMRKDPFPNLEWALIADGVPTKDVFKVLRTPAGVDRAFRKLDTIKKDSIWWSAGAQAPQLLADGQVVMTAAYHGRITTAIKETGRKFDIVWDAAQGGWGYWTIPKGSPRTEDAYKFLAYGGSIQPQAELTKYIPYGPGNKDAMALVDPAAKAYLSNTPERDAIALPTDYPFMLEHAEQLRARFNAWLAK